MGLDKVNDVLVDLISFIINVIDGIDAIEHKLVINNIATWCVQLTAGLLRIMAVIHARSFHVHRLDMHAQWTAYSAHMEFLTIYHDWQTCVLS